MTEGAAPVASDVDSVTLAGADKHSGKKIGLSVSCELMHNQLPASPVEPTRDIAVVQDSAGNPMLFAIGADRKFRLMRLEGGTATGFTAIDLSSQFKGCSGATAFDVSEDGEGRITVVVALAKDGGGTAVFMASMLSNDASKTDWSAFAKVAIQIAGIDPSFAAGKILLGTSDDGAPPLATIVGALGSQQVYYQVTRPDAPARPLEFPENVPTDPKALVDIAIGFAFGQRGVWYLYTEGQSQTLECRTLATKDQDPLTYDFSPGFKSIPASLRYSCVATAAGTDTDRFSLSSDIYVGTADGIRLFRNARAEQFETVTDRLKDVHQLVVKQDPDGIAVWAVCSPGELYYIHGTKGASRSAPYVWRQPILFRPSIIHVAPLRVRTRRTNELFVVNADLSVTHHWQDRRTTLWQQRLIKLPKTDYLFNAATFTSRIHLEDESGAALAGTPLELTASEWSYVTINGSVYSLDIDAPAKVATDESGTLTLISLASDIAPPIIHVRSTAFSQTVNVYPNGKIQRGLAAIKSGKDLRNVRLGSGSLVDPAIGSDTLDGLAGQIGHLTDASAQYIDGKRPAGTIYVAIEDGIRHTGALSFAHLPDDFAVGMRLEGGVWRPHAGAAADAARLGGVGDILDDIAGDVLHWLDNAFIDGIKLIEKGITHLEDGVSFVIRKVEDGLQFVLQLPGRLVSFVMKTLGAVLKALNWILKLIRIGLLKILEWLGHLFGWDEIWKAHKIIAALMRNGLKSAVAFADIELERARVELRKILGGLKAQVDNLVLPAGAASIQPRAVARSQQATPAGIAHRSAPAGFLHYQVQHGGMVNGGHSPIGPVADPLTAFLDDVVKPTAQSLIDHLVKDADDLVKLVSDPATSLQDMAKLLADLADTLIDPLTKLIDGLLKFAEDLLALVKHAVEYEIPIPFLSGFYEFITRLLGDEEGFTFINGCALLIAIPLVEIWRLSGHGTPFGRNADALQSPDLFHTLIGAPQAPHALAARAGASPRDARLLDSVASTVAHDYSRFGGAIGAVAGGLKPFLNLFGYGDRVSREGEDRIPLGHLSIFEKVAIVFNLAKFVGTVPVPAPGQSTAVYVLKVIAYATAAGQALLQLLIRGKAPADVVDMLDGAVACGADALILVLLMVADGLDDADGLTWASDSLSNAGGSLLGLRLATRHSEDPIVQGVSYAALAAGFLAALSGGGLTFYHAISLDDSKVLQAVNPGG